VATALLVVVADRFGDDPSPRLRELAADALRTKAFMLARMERLEDALLPIEQAISIYGGLAAADSAADQTGLDSAQKLRELIERNLERSEGS
jgi:hypothetical protein